MIGRLTQLVQVIGVMTLNKQDTANVVVMTHMENISNSYKECCCMGMSTSIVGIKPADDKWKKMKGVWDSCTAADIPIPDEVYDYFDGDEPNDLGVVVHKNKLGGAVTHLGSEFSGRGYVVDLTKLPPDIKLLKFENSW
jgi:hypothetical protein